MPKRKVELGEWVSKQGGTKVYVGSVEMGKVHYEYLNPSRRGSGALQRSSIEVFLEYFEKVKG